MFRLSLVALVFLIAAPFPATAENVRERLAMLEGEWTLEGREASFRETCEWFEGRSHMVCTSESRGAKGVRKGISVMSYSDEKKRFLYYHYASSGVVQALDLFLERGLLLATGERSVGTDLVRTEVTMQQRADGSFDFRERESKNGQPWEVTAQVHYIPRSDQAKGE